MGKNQGRNQVPGNGRQVTYIEGDGKMVIGGAVTCIRNWAHTLSGRLGA